MSDTIQGCLNDVCEQVAKAIEDWPVEISVRSTPDLPSRHVRWRSGTLWVEPSLYGQLIAERGNIDSQLN